MSDVDPRWASINIGVFICINCAGHHRGLGTHISKVRSVDLDAWDDEQVAHIRRWGNVRANAYWEVHVTMQRSDSNLGQWIRAKYEERAFATGPRVPRPEDLDQAIAPQSSRLRSYGQEDQRSTRKSNAKQVSTNLLDLDFGSPASAPTTPPHGGKGSKPLVDELRGVAGSPKVRTQSNPVTSTCSTLGASFAAFANFSDFAQSKTPFSAKPSSSPMKPSPSTVPLKEKQSRSNDLRPLDADSRPHSPSNPEPRGALPIQQSRGALQHATSPPGDSFGRLVDFAASSVPSEGGVVGDSARLGDSGDPGNSLI